MFSESGGEQRACGLALVALLAVVSCRERIVVGTEPSAEPSAALPSAPDAGSADVVELPDAGSVDVVELPDADDVEPDEDDDDDDDGDDAEGDTEDSGEDDD